MNFFNNTFLEKYIINNYIKNNFLKKIIFILIFRVVIYINFFLKNFLFKLLFFILLIVFFKYIFYFLNCYSFIKNNWLFFYIFEWIILFSTIFFINYLGTKGFFILNWFSSLLFTLNVILLFLEFNLNQMIILSNFGNFFKLNYSTVVNLCIYIDLISYNFVLLTSLISLFTYLYAYSYMRNELNLIYFLFYLKLFVLSMLLLLIAGNWITLLLGWELIGVSSFLLINFWTNKITTLKSAFKAFTFNKLSDCFLIIAFLIIIYFNNYNFYNILYTSVNFLNKFIIILNIKVSIIDIFLFCLIIGSFCKSAQFGFHFWLPDSMEAPVPASALIHSATLVSAGIYLLIRYNYLFVYSNFCSNFFLLITSFTCLYGALISSFQTDVKKILAYSTISHCGFLMISIIFSNIYISILYLYGHGFYKSLSFMCVGNLIQNSNNYQDFRKMGNYYYFSVFEFLFLLICIFNLSSLPFFLNFFTKHFLLNNINTLNFYNLVASSFIYFAAFCGVFYSLRLVYYCFLAFKKTHYSFYKILNIQITSLKFYKNILFRSNKLSIIAMLLLFIFSLIINMLFIYIYLNELYYLLDINNIFINYVFINNNFFFFKIIFFITIYSFIFIFISYKTINIFELQYIWIYFFLILFL